MSQRTLVIINPAASRASGAWPGIRSALSGSGLRFDSYETAFAGDATRRVREALREGYNTVAVVGGDGTLSEAAAGFFEFKSDGDDASAKISLPDRVKPDAALAILPAGTGDDFARGLAGERQPVDEWIKRLISYSRSGDLSGTRVVDVIIGQAAGQASEFICLNVSTIGLGAQVAARVAAQGKFTQRLPGEARFLSAACGALLMWRERPMRVTIDESETIECSSNLIAVANNTHAGGGMKFAPDARTDDGLIDLMLSCRLTRRAILRELPRIRSGGHISNPKVRLIKAKRVRLEPVTIEDALPVEADGNLRGHTPAEFQVMPSALRIVF